MQRPRVVRRKSFVSNEIPTSQYLTKGVKKHPKEELMCAYFCELFSLMSFPAGYISPQQQGTLLRQCHAKFKLLQRFHSNQREGPQRYFQFSVLR